MEQGVIPPTPPLPSLETATKPQSDVPGLQDDMSALQQKLEDGLNRMDDLCERRLREARQAAQQQVGVSSVDGRSNIHDFFCLAGVW